MDTFDKSKPKTINSLLDIERFSGESQARLGPIMYFLMLASAPFLLYAYFLLGRVPIKYVVPFFIIHVIRSWMVTLGNEKVRLGQFRQQLYDEYSSIGEVMSIKTIHEDGMVEYSTNKVAYLIATSNNSHLDDVYRAQMIRRLIADIPGHFNLDIRGQNMINVDNLSSRYQGVQFFGTKEAARDYLDIIDYNRKIIKEDTIITRTVFIISTRRQYFKELKSVVEALAQSNEVKAFKSLKIADQKLAREIISRDIDTYIDFEEINKMKYAQELYHGSYVERYDYVDVPKTKKELKFKHERRS